MAIDVQPADSGEIGACSCPEAPADTPAIRRETAHTLTSGKRAGRLRGLIAAAAVAATMGAAHAVAASDVVHLQTQSEQTQIAFRDGNGNGSATLINLNRQIGAWYLLQIEWPGGGSVQYHLEVPGLTPLRLAQDGLAIAGQSRSCATFQDLRFLSGKGEGYVPICEREVFVRQKQVGTTSLTEWGANFLRSQGLEDVVDTYKEWSEDAGLQRAELRLAEAAPVRADGPAPAQLAPSYQNQVMRIADLDLLLDGEGKNDLRPGRWSPLLNQKGVYFSAIQPGQVSRALEQPGDHAAALDAIEAGAVSYMVAFDLSQFTMGWSHGTDLPGVGWSRHFPNLKFSQEAGPDGFATLQPLVMTGRVNPTYLSRLIATLCGGFQRYHGAFSYGPLSQRPHKSYYGFIQEGIVLSTMHPDLATLIVYKDGTVALKAWNRQDDADMHRIRYARQNGVPLVARDALGHSVPGELVDNWGAGNWSGSKKSQLRSQRAGICISQQRDHQYLIYGYFSSATPSAMARVMQAYDCDVGMHLDMNSAGQSYLGLLSQTSSGQTVVEHPVREMSAFDTVKEVSGQTMPLPRYVGKADQSDFFYIVRRRHEAVALNQQ